MKLPRWLVISMLTSSLLAVLVAGGWWWITWPKRTAQEFLDLLAAQKYDEAEVIFEWSPGWKNQGYLVFHRERAWRESGLQSEPRSWSDAILGRQHFKYGRSLVFQFTVTRGKVIQSWYDFHVSAGGK